MRHHVAHHGEGLALGLARDGEVDRVEEAELAARAQRLEPPQVGHGIRGSQQRRHRAGIGRDHPIGRRRAAQRQPRHAEGRVLVGQRMVAGEVGRLGDAPGQLLRGAEGLLLADRRQVRHLQQAAVGLGHHQRRHQVFEHRARPRLEARLHAHRQEGPPERHPVAPRHVALGDRQEAQEARLGGQQVVVAGVELVVVDPKADVEEVALGVVEAAEIHLRAERLAAPRERFERSRRFGRRGFAVLRREGAAGLGHRDQVAREVAAVDAGHVGRRQHPQRLGVVPVVEMAVVLVHALDGVERGAEAAGQRRQVDPAEPVGAAAGQQVHADVGRRGPVGDRELGVELQVVRRQVVVLRADHALEEAPRVARQGRQVVALFDVECAFAARGYEAAPPGQQRRQRPEHEEAGAERGVRAPDERSQRQGDADCAGQCTAAQEAAKPVAGLRLRLRGGGPFEQMPAAEVDAPLGARGGVEQQPRLRRQLDELPGGAGQGAQQFGGADVEEMAQRDRAPGRHHAGQRAQQRRQHQRGDHRGQRPVQRQGPCEDHPGQQRGRGRCHQRATQVVAHLPEAERVDAEAARPKHQRQQLPVAAGPAVHPRGGDAGMVRMVFHQHQVAHPPRSGRSCLRADRG